MSNVDSPLGLDWASLRQIGTRRSTFKYELLDFDLNSLGDLEVNADSPPTIENNINRTIKRTLSEVLFRQDQVVDVNLLSDRLRVSMELPDGPYPLGVFMFADPSTIRSSSGNTIDVTMVDQGLILDQPIHKQYALAPGTFIVHAIKDRLESRNIKNFNVEETATQITGNWAVWPAGATTMEIINDLCAQAGFYSLYFDNEGVAICKSVPDLTASLPDIS